MEHSYYSTIVTFISGKSLYLDTNINKLNEMSVEITSAAFIGIIGTSFIIVYICRVITTQKTLKEFGDKFEQIKRDALDEDVIYNKKAKVYLTKDYIINFAKGLEIIDYNDISWIYPYEFRQNGALTQKSIYVITNNSKTHIIASVNVSKKMLAYFDEIYNSLLLKVPDALHGYTDENRKIFKERNKKKK